jgi:hypothetical protein
MQHAWWDYKMHTTLPLENLWKINTVREMAWDQLTHMIRSGEELLRKVSGTYRFHRTNFLTSLTTISFSSTLVHRVNKFRT